MVIFLVARKPSVTAGLMWQPETCPIVYAIPSRASPNAKATPRLPILSEARTALPGPMIISTAVPTISAARIRRFDCAVGDGVAGRGLSVAIPTSCRRTGRPESPCPGENADVCGAAGVQHVGQPLEGEAGVSIGGLELGRIGEAHAGVRVDRRDGVAGRGHRDVAHEDVAPQPVALGADGAGHGDAVA